MTGFFGWLKGIPGEIWAGLGAVAVVLGIIARERHDAKMEERRKNKQRELETREDMVGRTDEIVTEERNNAGKALEARDSGEHHPDYASLPDDLKAIAERRTRTDR